MPLNEEQYERIARWLDGEPIELSEVERAVAEEIRRDEAFVASLAPVQAPTTALDRARRRMTAELARPSHRTNWVGRFAVAAAAVAIAVLAAWMLMSDPGTKKTPIAKPGPENGEVPFEVVLEHMDDDTQLDEIDVLGDELAELRADIFLTMDEPEIDTEINALESELENVLLNGTGDWLWEEDV